MCTDAPDEHAEFWRKHLLITLQDRDWAERLMDSRISCSEIRVTAIAIISINNTMSGILRNLGGLASPW